MAKLPPLNTVPKKPSKYAPGKCPKCGSKMEDGECEKCEGEDEDKKVEIKLSILLPGGD